MVHPILFFMFKQPAVRHLHDPVFRQKVEAALAEFHLHVFFAMDRVFMQEAFWVEHYRTTFERKTNRCPGDGGRYREKILSKHTDTWCVPLVVRDMLPSQTVPELVERKNRLRVRILQLTTFDESVIPSDLLHISDDLKNAQLEIRNLFNYLTSHPTCMPGDCEAPSDSKEYLFDTSAAVTELAELLHGPARDEAASKQRVQALLDSFVHGAHLEPVTELPRDITDRVVVWSPVTTSPRPRLGRRPSMHRARRAAAANGASSRGSSPVSGRSSLSSSVFDTPGTSAADASFGSTDAAAASAIARSLSIDSSSADAEAAAALASLELDDSTIASAATAPAAAVATTTSPPA